MYELGKKSLDKLADVHPKLAKVIVRAITITTQDFTVVQGLRTLEEQKRLVAAGKSQTMKSRHLTGHAVDLAPWVGNTTDWEDHDKFTVVAEAVREAARKENVEVLWGAAWHLALNYFPSAKEAREAYVKDCKAKGKKPFIDAPHFQLTWKDYP